MFEITTRILQRWIEEYNNTGNLERKREYCTSNIKANVLN